MVHRLAAILVAVSIVKPASALAVDTPPLLVEVTCADAPRPGRVRCRARVELSIEAARDRRITWAELAVVETSPGVSALRARLGPLDAESRDDAHIAWTFSLTASPGAHRASFRAHATLQRDSATPTPTVMPYEQTVEAKFNVGEGP